MATTEQMPPLQVSIDEAARLLGYCRRSVYHLLEAGELRSVGKGRLRRVPMAELEGWQQRNMR